MSTQKFASQLPFNQTDSDTAYYLDTLSGEIRATFDIGQLTSNADLILMTSEGLFVLGEQRAQNWNAIEILNHEYLTSERLKALSKSSSELGKFVASLSITEEVLEQYYKYEDSSKSGAILIATSELGLETLKFLASEVSGKLWSETAKNTIFAKGPVKEWLGSTGAEITTSYILDSIWEDADDIFTVYDQIEGFLRGDSAVSSPYFLIGSHENGDPILGNAFMLDGQVSHAKTPSPVLLPVGLEAEAFIPAVEPPAHMRLLTKDVLTADPIKNPDAEEFGTVANLVGASMTFDGIDGQELQIDDTIPVSIAFVAAASADAANAHYEVWASFNNSLNRNTDHKVAKGKVHFDAGTAIEVEKLKIKVTEEIEGVNFLLIVDVDTGEVLQDHRIDIYEAPEPWFDFSIFKLSSNRDTYKAGYDLGLSARGTVEGYDSIIEDVEVQFTLVSLDSGKGYKLAVDKGVSGDGVVKAGENGFSINAGGKVSGAIPRGAYELQAQFIKQGDMKFDVDLSNNLVSGKVIFIGDSRDAEASLYGLHSQLAKLSDTENKLAVIDYYLETGQIPGVVARASVIKSADQALSPHLSVNNHQVVSIHSSDGSVFTLRAKNGKAFIDRGVWDLTAVHEHKFGFLIEAVVNSDGTSRVLLTNVEGRTTSVLQEPSAIQRSLNDLMPETVGGAPEHEDTVELSIGPNANNQIEIYTNGEIINLTKGGKQVAPNSKWSVQDISQYDEGFLVLWLRIDGNYQVWSVNSRGEYVDHQSLMRGNIEQWEAYFKGVDLNGDGEFYIEPEEVQSSVPVFGGSYKSLSIGSSSNGHVEIYADGEIIDLMKGGKQVEPNSKWSAQGIAEYEQGFLVQWLRFDGTYQVWEVNARGLYVNHHSLKQGDIAQWEAFFPGIDLDGDGDFFTKSIHLTDEEHQASELSAPIKLGGAEDSFDFIENLDRHAPRSFEAYPFSKGQDVIQVTPNADGSSVKLSDNDDHAVGTDGVDVISGRLGNDVIGGGRGNDVLNGVKGDDTVFGGEDDDVLYGGPGSDIFFFRAHDGNDVIVDWGRNGDPDSILFDDGLSVTAYQSGVNAILQLEGTTVVVENTLLEDLDGNMGYLSGGQFDFI